MKNTNDEMKIDFTNFPQACADASEKFHQAVLNADWSKYEIDLIDFSNFLGGKKDKEQPK